MAPNTDRRRDALLEEVRPALLRALRIARALCRSEAAEISVSVDGAAWRIAEGGDVQLSDESAAVRVAGPGVTGRLMVGAGQLTEGTLALLSDVAKVIVDEIVRVRTQRQNAEVLEQMARSQERLRIAVENADLHVYECDYVNRTLLKEGAEDTFFERPKTYKDVAYNVWGDVHPEDRPAAMALWDRCQAEGRRWRVEYRFLRSDGKEVWASSSAKLIADKQGRPQRLIGTLQNITPRKELERRIADTIRHAAASLEAKRAMLNDISTDLGAPLPAPPASASADMGPLGDLERLLAETEARDAALKEAVDKLRASRTAAQAADMAKSRFIATMSHELRTPLNAVIGYAELVSEDLTAAEMTRSAADVGRIRSAARRLLSIISDILEYTELDAENPTVQNADVDVGALLLGVARDFRADAEAGGNRLTCKAAPGLVIRSDAAKLRRCVEILLSNACKFTAKGRIELSVSVVRGRATVNVRDSGVGIPEAQLATLFRPFSQAESGFTRSHDGAGMGLAICRRLAGLLGGELSARSKPGSGSTFSLHVPSEVVARRTA